jgi:hypothetical protein
MGRKLKLLGLLGIATLAVKIRRARQTNEPDVLDEDAADAIIKAFHLNNGKRSRKKKRKGEQNLNFLPYLLIHINK